MSVCPTCGGNRFTLKTDFLRAKNVRIPCVTCKGSGEIIEKVKDGLVVGRIEGVTYVWQWKIGGEPVSSLEVRIRQVKDNGVPQFHRPNPMFKKVVMRLYGEIVRMNTKPDFQGKGLMNTILGTALADPKVEWYETNWDDSTEGGRAFLEKRGFKREGNKLIWERQGKVTE